MPLIWMDGGPVPAAGTDRPRKCYGSGRSRLEQGDQGVYRLLQRRFKPAESGQRVTVKLALDEPTMGAIEQAAGAGNATLSATVNDLLRRGVERLQEQGLPRLEDRPAHRVRWDPQGEVVWTTVSTDQETSDLARDLAYRWYTTQHNALQRLLAEGLRED